MSDVSDLKSKSIMCAVDCSGYLFLTGNGFIDEAAKSLADALAVSTMLQNFLANKMTVPCDTDFMLPSFFFTE